MAKKRPTDRRPARARRTETEGVLRSLRRPEALAAGLAGGLAFLVQPLAARTLLPAVGGSAIVWATTLAFFQVALVLGYCTAVWISHRPKRAWALVVAVAPTPLLWHVPQLAPPWNVLAALATGVGLPYVALASIGVALQATHRPDAGSPYRLATASNLGSAVGLLLGLALSEFVGLRIQRTTWWAITAATVVFAVTRIARGTASSQSLRGTPPSAWRAWVAWSALASGLLVAIATALAMRIEVLPMLWPVPLAVFLVIFARAFAHDHQSRPGRSRGILLAAAAVLALTPLLIGERGGAGRFDPLVFAAYVFLFGVGCWIAVRRLADGRPAPEHLGAFWVWVAIGGGLGGSIVALVLPVTLPWPWEFTMLSLVAALAAPAAREAVREFRLIGALVGLAAIAVVIAGKPLATAGGGDVALAGIACVLAVALIGERAIAAGLAVIVALGVVLVSPFEPGAVVVERGRSPYGAWAVGSLEGVRFLFHNDILHGHQTIEGPKRTRPSAYYGVDTGLGHAIDLLRGRTDWPQARVAVVGVGSGTVVAYAGPDQHWDLFELDPDMFHVAEDIFTYVGDAPEGITSDFLGDARLELEGRADDTYDLLILDAYLGDSIPAHLLSVEAFELYDAKRRPGGVLLAHVSSRMFDLKPIIAAGAEAVGLACRYLETPGAKPTDTEPYQSSASWVACTDDDAFIDGLEADGWSEVEGRLRWTDDFAPIIRALG